MTSLMKNQTWELTPLQEGKNIIGCKWVYKTKFTYDKAIEKHKARWLQKDSHKNKVLTIMKHFIMFLK
jgi:hypothetical protein